MRVIWLFYHFFKIQVHILHGLENISIFNIWKLWLVRCDVIFSGTSLILPKMSENFWSKEIPLWWFPDPTLKLNNSRMAWPIPAIYISFSSILNALLYEINLFSRCSSPLNAVGIRQSWWNLAQTMAVIVVLDSNKNFQISSLFEGLSMRKGELPFKWILAG